MSLAGTLRRLAFSIASIALILEIHAQGTAQNGPQPRDNLARSRDKLVELSLGYNRISLDTNSEADNLNGINLSAFVNMTSRLSLGGEVMANFGSRDGFRTDIDSERYIYLFGPRVTVWRTTQFRVLLEALLGGVYGHVEVDDGVFIRRFSDSGVAMAVGGGFDWRFSEDFSWRIVHFDYLPTNLGEDWQHNFRLSTEIVYMLGRRR